MSQRKKLHNFLSASACLLLLTHRPAPPRPSSQLNPLLHPASSSGMKIFTFVSVALGLASAVASRNRFMLPTGLPSSRAVRMAHLASKLKAHRQQSTRSASTSLLYASEVGNSTSSGCGSNCESTLAFAGQAAAAHQVGSEIPGWPFPVQKSWAGNLPTGESNPNSTLFFWLWGAEEKKDDEDL